MKVVCSGGYKTGSTFVYAVVLEIFKAANMSFLSGVIDESKIIDLDDNLDWVIKSHNWIPPIDTDIKTIYTRRDYLDVYASFEKIEKYKKRNIDIIDNIILEKSRRRTMIGRLSLTLDYEDFYENEIYAVEQVDNYLFGWHNRNRLKDYPVIDIAKRLSKENMKPITDKPCTEDGVPWHTHHISEDPSPGNYIDVLDPETIERVVRAYRES